MRFIRFILLMIVVAAGIAFVSDREEKHRSELESMEYHAIQSQAAADALTTRVLELEKDYANQHSTLQDLVGRYLAVEKATQADAANIHALTEQFAKLPKSCPPPQVTAGEFAQLAEKVKRLEHKDNCQPPETVAKEKQPQPVAPSAFTKDGRRQFHTDFDKAVAVGKQLNRPVLLIMGTTSCPHCDIVAENCTRHDVMDAACKFVPCWITAVDEDSKAISQKYGGWRHGFPWAAVIQPNGDWDAFRPSENPELFIEQLKCP